MTTISLFPSTTPPATQPPATQPPATQPPATQPALTRTASRKAPNAFRTISETADELQVPQHVLRFWETKFPQLRPIKRGGGRRYYRPEDLDLLRRISSLLYVEGYTIKAVQRLLREGGGETPVEATADADDSTQPMLDLAEASDLGPVPSLSPAMRAVLANVLSELEEWRDTFNAE
jgi:DNA-binding transcriptional MerR regulator